MSSIELDDAYERHEFLPLAMNWLGIWDVTTVYFTNDIAVSPIDSASYVMIGPQTSLRGGDDPSINTTNWFQYGTSVATVQNIRAGDGIELTGSEIDTIVENTGVVSIVPGEGFTNIGTASDPILTCDTLTAIVPGLGIDVFGIPIPNIENTGVTIVREGPGISITNVNQDLTINNTGLQSLTAAPTDAGVTVSAGPIKTITNTGLLTIAPGTGIINTGTSTEPILANGGVVSLNPLNDSISITGNGSVLKLSSNIPRKCIVWRPTIATEMSPNPTTSTGSPSTIAVAQEAGLWANCLATGVPFGFGYFALTMPYTFSMDVNFLSSALFTINLFDGVNNIQFPIRYRVYNPRVTANNTVIFGLGTRLINLETLRASGFRQLTAIQVSAGTPAIYLESVGGPAYATFYPFTAIVPP